MARNKGLSWVCTEGPSLCIISCHWPGHRRQQSRNGWVL